jgi:hypothetical protein
MIVIKNYDHMTVMDENMSWMKLTNLLSKFSLNLKAFLVDLPLLQKLL